MARAGSGAGRTRIVAAGAGVGVGIAGLVVGVIALVPQFTSNSTTADDLVVATSAPNDQQLALYEGIGVSGTGAGQLGFRETYMIPIDTDWASFPDLGPANDLYVCTEAQVEWLAARGLKVADTYFLEFTNTASDGSSLTVSDIRGDGTVPDSPTRVAFECQYPQGGEIPLQFGKLTLGSSEAAIFEAEHPEGGGLSGEGDVLGEAFSPVVFNLEPGEVARLHLSVESLGKFTGRIVATVTSGQTKGLLVIAEGYGTDRATRESGLDDFSVLLFGGIHCNGADYDPLMPFDSPVCSMEEVVSKLGSY